VAEILLRPLQAETQLGRLPGIEDAVIDVGQGVQVDEAGADDRVACVDGGVDRLRVVMAHEHDSIAFVYDLAIAVDDVVVAAIADDEAAGELSLHGTLPSHALPGIHNTSALHRAWMVFVRNGSRLRTRSRVYGTTCTSATARKAYRPTPRSNMVPRRLSHAYGGRSTTRRAVTLYM
jgi:hypothetical protein